MSLPYGDNVNVELFQAIKRQILNDPKSFDMRDWGHCGHGCKTVGCIAGWANIINHERNGGSLDNFNGNDPIAAMELLGLPPSGHSGYPGADLFYPSHWPVEFIRRYNQCYGPACLECRAQVAADLIDYVCYGPGGKPPEPKAPPIDIMIEAPVQEQAKKLAV